MTKKTSFYVWVLLYFGLFSLNACYTPRGPDAPMSQRVFPKPRAMGISKIPPKKSGLQKSQLYKQGNNVSITPVNKPNTNGSLYNLEDERNYLFATRAPLTIGRYVTVNVASNRQGQQDEPEQQADGQEGEQQNDEISQDELFKALPDLEPGEKSEAKLFKTFKMKITHRFDNGDVMAVYTRKSDSEDDQHDISVSARIPHQQLITGDPISTNDLTSIKLTEVTKDEVVERNSVGWEDEYTARISGFSEANSKLAARLEDKRKQLKGVKDRLITRIENLAKERKTWANERNKLLEDGQQATQKIEQLNETITKKDDEIKTQKEKITEQENQIKELTKVEDKPGDEKDATSGQ